MTVDVDMHSVEIDAVPRDRIVLGYGSGQLALFSVSDEDEETETIRRWPWSRPQMRVTRERGTYLYIAIPGAHGFGKLIPRGGWVPTHWCEVNDLNLVLDDPRTS